MSNVAHVRNLLLLTFLINKSSRTCTSEQAHTLPNYGVIVALPNWSYLAIAEECVNFLGPQGYTGVQIAPVTAHRPEDTPYQPISYDFATTFGTEQELLLMTRTCNAVGVRIYVDIVLNHMAAMTTAMDNESLSHTETLAYPDVPYTAKDFHMSCTLQAFTLDAHVMRNCQLAGQPDLDQSRPHVREQLLNVMNKLVELGVAGFHVLHAKYMWPFDLKELFAAVRNLNHTHFDFARHTRPLFYQDVYDVGNDSVSGTEYIEMGPVSEHLYAEALWHVVVVSDNAGDLIALTNWATTMSLLPHSLALVFVYGQVWPEQPKMSKMSHSYESDIGTRYLMASLLMLAHPYGCIKRLTNLDATSAGLSTPLPSADKVDRPSEIESIHRWPPIVRMLQLVNSLPPSETGEVDNLQWQTSQQLAYCRGRLAFVAINMARTARYAAVVQTCFTEPGVFCDVVSGGRRKDGRSCYGLRVRVSSAFRLATIDLQAQSVLAIYVGSKLLTEEQSSVDLQQHEKEKNEHGVAKEEEWQIRQEIDELKAEQHDMKFPNVNDTPEQCDRMVEMGEPSQRGDVDKEGSVGRAGDE